MRTWLGKKERNGFAFQNEKERIERDRVFGAERRATKLTEFKRRHLIGENAYRCVVLIGFPDSIFVFRDSASMSEKTDKKEKKVSVPYKKYIIESIQQLDSKKGCSVPAIEKCMKQMHSDIEFKHTMVRLIIKKMVENGELKPNRYHKNSYHIVKDALKAKTTKKAAPKKAAKKAAPKKEKKEGEKKTEKKTKKAAPKEKKEEEKTEKKAVKKAAPKKEKKEGEKAKKAAPKKTEKKEKATPKKTEKKEKKAAPKKTEKKEKPAKKENAAKTDYQKAEKKE